MLFFHPRKETENTVLIAPDSVITGMTVGVSSVTGGPGDKRATSSVAAAVKDEDQVDAASSVAAERRRKEDEEWRKRGQNMTLASARKLSSVTASEVS